MNRVFGFAEAVFNFLYLTAAISIGYLLIFSGSYSPARFLAGIMAFVLAAGDAFHLVPRIDVIITGREPQKRRAMGVGKQIASITMTIFYLLLWHIGLIVFVPRNAGFWAWLIYFLAAARILLCLMPQNRWRERYPPVKWGIWRNIPFLLQGMVVAALFYLQGNTAQGLELMWLAVFLSFAFYIPVVLWSNVNPKIGMLMLPKTCAYLWILSMCLSL